VTEFTETAETPATSGTVERVVSAVVDAGFVIVTDGTTPEGAAIVTVIPAVVVSLPWLSVAIAVTV